MPFHIQPTLVIDTQTCRDTSPIMDTKNADQYRLNLFFAFRNSSIEYSPAMSSGQAEMQSFNQ